MKFSVSSQSIASFSADSLILFSFADYTPEKVNQIDTLLKGKLLQHMKDDLFTAKVGNIYTFSAPESLLVKKIYVVGLGDKKKSSVHSLRDSIGMLMKQKGQTMASVIVVPLEQKDTSISIQEQAQAIVEGMRLGTYQFMKYKKQEDEKKKVLEIVSFGEDNKTNKGLIEEGIRLGNLFSEATILARDLVNEPSAVMTPTALAQLAQDIAKAHPEITCKVYGKEEAEKMGMGAFLGIAQAADTPPQFIHLEYTPKQISAKQIKKLAIIGKGITFDSGGISLKPEEHMRTMKCDMAGAAAVLGVFSVISEIKPGVPVMGLIAATANMVSGKSLVPGDVVTAMNKKTIEILNTDAEGRVTLADSISYALTNKATHLIDLATLTGACMVGLGNNIAGLFSNDEKLKELVMKSSQLSGEKVWELPLEEEYKQLNKSEVADIANLGASRYGGAITAALFLEAFVDQKPWVHLDIAGPAFLEGSYSLGPKGATGFGVRTLLRFLQFAV